MAFSAVVSVEQILQQLLHSDNPYGCDDCLKPEIEAFRLKIESLRLSLGKIYPINSRIRDKVNKLESDIRETVYGSQDRIEEFISSQIYRYAFLLKLKEPTGELETILATSISPAGESFDPVIAELTSIDQILEKILSCDDDLFPCDDCPDSEIKSFQDVIRSLRSAIRKRIEDAMKDLGSRIELAVHGARDWIEGFITSQANRSVYLPKLKENSGNLDVIEYINAVVALYAVMAFAVVVSVEQILEQVLPQVFRSGKLIPCDDCPNSEICCLYSYIRKSLKDMAKELGSKIEKRVQGARNWIEEFISSEMYRSALLPKLKENARELDTIVATVNSLSVKSSSALLPKLKENTRELNTIMAKANSLSVQSIDVAVVLLEHMLQQVLYCDNLFYPESKIESLHVKIFSSIRSSISDKVNKLKPKIRFYSLPQLKKKPSEATQNSSPVNLSDPVMAVADVASVEETLWQVLDDCPKSEMETFYVNIRCLQSSIISVIREVNVNEWQSKIRNGVCKVLDLIEAFISSQTAQTTFLQNLKENRGKLDPIVAMAKEIADSMEEKQQRSGQSSTNVESSKHSRASKSSKIVGQEKDLKKLKDVILKDTPDRLVIPITGLPGSGKTTLARCIFEDEEIRDGFAIRSWVTVGQEYNAEEIFSKLLASVHRSDGSYSTKTNHWNAEQLAFELYKSLFNNRYLIVVDDVWDIFVWDRITKYLPDNNKSSRVVVTTRIDNIAVKVESNFNCHKMKELDKNESWELLREKVFGDAHCPPDLMTIGKSIANNCHGLPLSISVVGGQLSQEIKNTEYWKTVEEDIRAAIDLSGEDYLRAILSRSYEHLPCRLKGCFLYMGAFPEDSEVTVCKLVKLWVAEGFLEQTELLSLEDNAEQCLTDLLDRNLIFPLKFSSNGKVKTCGMHDSIRSLAEIKSEEESFFVSVKKFPSQRNRSSGLIADSLKGKDTQRRISVHKNILMCMEDVYKSAKSVKPARTLLYAGHYHHHPLPFCLSYHWLRVLDALTVHLTKFPKGLVKLIHLRYLSLTYNGKLPASLSQLKNLLVLIVRRHPKIVIMGKPVLPVEIWYMKKLRHILLTECDFPDLSGIQVGNIPLLENLQSLSSINVACCTEGFFKNMPNLKKLGIWIEAPGPVNFDPDLLPELEAFKLTVLKPIPGKEIKLQKSLVSPMKLKKLSLSGCGLPWKCMADIGKFPCLQVLKLRQFAFQGPEWTPVKEQFPMLKLLLIECLDLEYLKLGRFCCEILESLIIKNCYELQEIDQELIRIGTLKHVELVGCNYDVVHCAEVMRDELSDAGKEWQLRIYSSWGEESSPDGMQLS